MRQVGPQLRRFVSAACCAGGLAACGGEPPAQHTPPPVREEEVVARVGEQVIDANAVRAYVAEHGVSPRDALRALEDDALLGLAARRAGWSGVSEAVAARTREQVLAQRVLLDLEREHPLEGPTEDEVAAYAEAHVAELVQEERRDCLQVLVQLPADATEAQVETGRVYAERTLARMAHDGVEAVWAVQPEEHDGLRVVSQYPPPATPSTPMPYGFREAVFALQAPGPVAAPVRTPSGWHAVAVTAIHPPITAGSTEALAIARRRMVTEARREAFEALVRAAAERFPVAVSTRNTEALLPLVGPQAGPGT